MIVHLVLFTPRADLSDSEHETLRRAVDVAFSRIPSVRRFQVGRRVRLGTSYDEAGLVDYAYCAVIEFVDSSGLREYLAHPAHQDLGRLFYETSAEAFAGDFETVDTAAGDALARWRRS
jgi:hypothetical protein